MQKKVVNLGVNRAIGFNDEGRSVAREGGSAIATDRYAMQSYRQSVGTAGDLKFNG